MNVRNVDLPPILLHTRSVQVNNEFKVLCADAGVWRHARSCCASFGVMFVRDV